MKTLSVLSGACILLQLLSPSLIAERRSEESDRKEILGVWRGQMPGDAPGSIELVITPDQIRGRNPRTGKSLGEGTYQMDPAQKTIDPLRVEKFGRGRQYVGIYSLEGDTLRWCSTSRKQNRPKELVHKPERDQFLMVLQRQR